MGKAAPPGAMLHSAAGEGEGGVSLDELYAADGPAGRLTLLSFGSWA